MYLPDEIIEEIFSYLNLECHCCKVKIKHPNLIYLILKKNYTQFIFCSENCYNFN